MVLRAGMLWSMAMLPHIYLASTSPRRQQLLREAGMAFELLTPALDDAHLEHPAQVAPEQWVAALAYFKAASAVPAVPRDAPDASLILGADTVVELDGSIIGQPPSRDEARRIIAALASRVHDVITGVALLNPATGRSTLLTDRAVVTVGQIPEAEIDAYLDTGQWQGKAGGYNLAERQAAGWPIDVQGDPATVMGLPIRTLLAYFRT